MDQKSLEHVLSPLEQEYDRIIKLLKNKRQSLEKSQSQVADMCGISFTTVSAIERGIQVCSAMTLIGYLRALHMDYADLDLHHSSQNNGNATILPELAEAISVLSPEQQTRLILIINAVFN